MRNILLLSLLPVAALLNAQTYFYELSAVVENGNRSVGNGSGIYVTFIDKGCYDSDVDGCTMNNGFLDLHIKGKNKISYKGTSYWGDAEYIFSADYKLLNVLAGNSVYIYRRSYSPTRRISTYYGTKALKGGGSVNPMYVGSMLGDDVVDNGDEYRGKLSPEQYREHYARWENQARSCYESLVNIVKTDSGDEVHTNKYGVNESLMHVNEMTKLLIRVQGEMRKMRSEAASYGVTIMQSRWETCSPPSRY